MDLLYIQQGSTPIILYTCKVLKYSDTGTCYALLEIIHTYIGFSPFFNVFYNKDGYFVIGVFSKKVPINNYCITFIGDTSNKLKIAYDNEVLALPRLFKEEEYFTFVLVALHIENLPIINKLVPIETKMFFNKKTFLRELMYSLNLITDYETYLTALLSKRSLQLLNQCIFGALPRPIGFKLAYQYLTTGEIISYWIVIEKSIPISVLPHEDTIDYSYTCIDSFLHADKALVLSKYFEIVHRNNLYNVKYTKHDLLTSCWIFDLYYRKKLVAYRLSHHCEHTKDYILRIYESRELLENEYEYLREAIYTGYIQLTHMYSKKRSLSSEKDLRNYIDDVFDMDEFVYDNFIPWRETDRGFK